MTSQTIKDQAGQFVERGKELAEEGQQRHVVFYKKDGSELFKSNLTILAIVAVVLLATSMFPVAVIAGIVAMLMGVRAELVNPEA